MLIIIKHKCIPLLHLKSGATTKISFSHVNTANKVLKKGILNIISKEIESNVKVNRTEKANELTYQKNLIQEYLPKQLSEDEIKTILNTLEDKAIPSVMKYFKTNYNGLVDMSLVSKLARQ